MSAEKIRIIVISSVRPEPTSAGPIVLHRHLVSQPWIDLEIYGAEPGRRTFRSLIRRGIGQLKKIALGKWSEVLWGLWKGRWLDEHLPREVDPSQTTVVLTVAHGDACHTAQRFARRHHLPVVVWFQDWWPDLADVPRCFRPLLERHFRELYQRADLALCICEGMKEELGPHPNAVVLPPVSDDGQIGAGREESSIVSSEFKVIYSGTLGEYGPMMASLIRESLNHPELLIQARGANPEWDPEFIEAMTQEGRLLPFAPRDEFNDWLRTADAFIVPMVFEPKMRRRMRTSFPSKLIEFAQLGKPLIVWGPDDCSAIRWAHVNGYHLTVTSEDPEKVIQEIKMLAESSDAQKIAATKNLQEIRKSLNPRIIKEDFENLIRDLGSGLRTGQRCAASFKISRT